MSVSSKANVSDIETYLCKMFKSVSDHVFPSAPDTLGKDWEDMLVISCDNGVNDYNGYGNGNALLFAYARPHSNGTKNVKKLSAMEKAILDLIETQDSSGNYYVHRIRSFSDYDYSRNWHCNVISIGITVK